MNLFDHINLFDQAAHWAEVNRIIQHQNRLLDALQRALANRDRPLVIRAYLDFRRELAYSEGPAADQSRKNCRRVILKMLRHWRNTDAIP